MKNLAAVLVLCLLMISCNIQEEVEQASQECQSVMLSVIDEIKELQEGSCLTKDQLVMLLEIRLKQRDVRKDCDVVMQDGYSETIEDHK